MNDPQTKRLSSFKADTVQTLLFAALAVLLAIVGSDRALATLPDIPRGCAVLNTGNKAIHQLGILNNPNVDIISIAADWYVVEPIEGTYIWKPINDDLAAIATSQFGSTKSAVLRINTMGGSSLLTGKTPDWAFDDMHVPNNQTTSGFTYGFIDGAKKKAMIAAAGADITSDPVRNATLKVVVISYANAVTEDWYMPNDDTGSPSQVDLWLHLPTDDVPGAGYTTQRMIDAAIHQADATFTDGSVKGLKLTSISANFTQADIGCSITGLGYGQKTPYRNGWGLPKSY